MTAFERQLIKETQTTTAKDVNAMVSHMLTRQDFESIKTGMTGRYSKQRLPIAKECVELLKGEIQVNSV